MRESNETGKSPNALPIEIATAFQALRGGARRLRSLSGDQKNQLLFLLADKVEKSQSDLLSENAKDLMALPEDALTSFRDRLTLTPERIRAMVESLRQVARLPDPIGEEVEASVLKNGLRLRRVRAPLGVIFMIFESRPNVILEAFSLAFKSGNVIALRGGSDSRWSAKFLYRILTDSLNQVNFTETVKQPSSAPLPAPAPADASGSDFFYGMDDYKREWVHALLKRKDWIDIVVPRGGQKLIEFVQEHALMPIIKNDRGMCHAFVDASADLEMAADIVLNAKLQRPGVCNSLETVLVHTDVASAFYELLVARAYATTLELHACAASHALLTGFMQKRTSETLKLKAATANDWDTEYLDAILNCKIVSGIDEALQHIEKHSSRHSETIITKSEEQARRFQREIDSAAVYWNASTRFTDGFEFGLGGELGISTQKLHTRGPIGLRELTTPRWLIDGSGQIRK